jgi:L-arabinose isomerase
LNAGSPHHMALAYGHLANKLHTLAKLGKWDFIVV